MGGGGSEVHAGAVVSKAGPEAGAAVSAPWRLLPTPGTRENLSTNQKRRKRDLRDPSDPDQWSGGDSGS